MAAEPEAGQSSGAGQRVPFARSVRVDGSSEHVDGCSEREN